MSIPDELTWHVLRATGITAWLLLTGAVVGGLLLRTRLLPGPRPAWLLDLHRGVAGLAVVHTTLHVVAAVLDPWLGLSPLGALVPFVADWRPAALAPGVVALHLLLAVQVTSLLRRRVGTTWWRRVHLTAVPAWGLATGHLVAAGTDVGLLLLGTVLVGTALVVLPWTFRLLQPRHRRPRTRGAAA